MGNVLAVLVIAALYFALVNISKQRDAWREHAVFYQSLSQGLSDQLQSKISAPPTVVIRNQNLPIKDLMILCHPDKHQNSEMSNKIFKQLSSLHAQEKHRG